MSSLEGGRELYQYVERSPDRPRASAAFRTRLQPTMYGPHNAHDDVVYVQFGPSLERDDTRDMTDEEKKALGRAINKLNSVNLDRVVEIITEHLPRIDHDDDDTEKE